MNRSTDTSDVLSDPTASAFICLKKLSEFTRVNSDNNVLTNRSNIQKSIDFIREIIPAEFIVVASIANNGTKSVIHAGYGLHKDNRTLGSDSVLIVSELAKGKVVFNENDSELRKNITDLFGGIDITSGVCVPIRISNKTYGMLAVLSQENRSFTASKLIFLEHMASLISHQLQQSLVLPFSGDAAQKLFRAKIEWEQTVDSLPQLFIVLDDNGQIIRVNKTMQRWGLGTVSSHLGVGIESLLQGLTGEDETEVVQHWQCHWAQCQKYGSDEWERANKDTSQVLRYSLHLLESSQDADEHSAYRGGHATLIISDITQCRVLENKKAIYTNSLEQEVKIRTAELQDLNTRLREELEEQNRNRKALQQSEARNNQVVQYSLAGVIILNDGYIEFSNRRFAEMFSFGVKQVLGRPFLSFVEPSFQKEVTDALEKLSKNETRNYSAVIKIIGARAKQYWIEIKFDLLNTLDPSKILVNIFDVTKQKEVELDLRDSQHRLRNLSTQLIQTQETERKRIALELHDGMGQAISAIKYKLEIFAKHNTQELDPSGIQELDDMSASLGMAIEEIRGMAMDLRPSILDDLGIILTLSWFCREFQQTYKSITVQQEIYLPETEIPEKLKIVIYRMVQEAFNNVVKHANATMIVLKLYKSKNELYLMIKDNGCGIQANNNQPPLSGGSGQNNMRERVELSGGSYSVGSNIPSGTQLTAVWPLTLQ